MPPPAARTWQAPIRPESFRSVDRASPTATEPCISRAGHRLIRDHDSRPAAAPARWPAPRPAAWPGSSWSRRHSPAPSRQVLQQQKALVSSSFIKAGANLCTQAMASIVLRAPCAMSVLIAQANRVVEHTFTGRRQQPLAQEAANDRRGEHSQPETNAGCHERRHQQPWVGCRHLLTVPPVAACNTIQSDMFGNCSSTARCSGPLETRVPSPIGCTRNAWRKHCKQVDARAHSMHMHAKTRYPMSPWSHRRRRP
jgi:hypothetical protein